MHWGGGGGGMAGAVGNAAAAVVAGTPSMWLRFGLWPKASSVGLDKAGAEQKFVAHLPILHRTV